MRGPGPQARSLMVLVCGRWAGMPLALHSGKTHAPRGETELEGWGCVELPVCPDLANLQPGPRSQRDPRPGAEVSGGGSRQMGGFLLHKGQLRFR